MARETCPAILMITSSPHPIPAISGAVIAPPPVAFPERIFENVQPTRSHGGVWRCLWVARSAYSGVVESWVCRALPPSAGRGSAFKSRRTNGYAARVETTRWTRSKVQLKHARVHGVAAVERPSQRRTKRDKIVWWPPSRAS